MGLRNICESLDEDRVTVHTLGPLDAWKVPGIFHHLEIQLVKGFNMVTGERNGHENDVGVPTLYIFLDSVACLGTKPGGRSDLGLPAQTVGVAEIQSLHDSMDSGSDFCRVRITYDPISQSSMQISGVALIPLFTTLIGKLCAENNNTALFLFSSGYVAS